MTDENDATHGRLPREIRQSHTENSAKLQSEILNPASKIEGSEALQFETKARRNTPLQGNSPTALRVC